MIRTLVKTVGFAVAVLGVMSTLAGAAVMICTKEQETVLSSPAPRPTRQDCVMARGADGQEVPVMVLNAKVGDRLDCSVIDGKIACK
jgi:hypothetical protein